MSGSAKILIANRGEIACRIERTLERLGLPSVAVYSEADADSLHVRRAGEAVCLGPAPVHESYLRIDRLVAAAVATGATVVHPGYGLLSENAAFAEACEAAGIRFAGPTPAQIHAFGLKHEARALAVEAGVPVVPGTELLTTLEAARRAARELGYPVLLKATAGGGGIGMAPCADESALVEAFERVGRLARDHFGAGGVFLERWVPRARHVEVQVFGDGRGRVVAVGDRDCSLQRRRQKVVEEAPAPSLSPATRAAIHDAAVRLAASVSYRSAGTVEFLVDAESEAFYFLEVNARLQVEHPVTESVTGVDLVEWMIALALDRPVDLGALPPEPRGHAIEVRLYAEDPARDFQPSPGTITHVEFPSGTRVDGWIEAGTEITPYYDPLLAKLVAVGADRAAALANLDAALAATRVDGIETNLAYLRQAIAAPDFAAARPDTGLLARLDYHPATVDVLSPGTFTTVQDHPGRLGYWEVGVPPSGAMDPLALRLGNRIVGNRDDLTALEITATGPTLRFRRDALVCVAGAAVKTTLDGVPVSGWTPIAVAAGSTLALGAVGPLGLRSYLCVRGGFDVPAYLGSRSTFTLGGFGGHGGRKLQAGDVLHLGDRGDAALAPDAPLDGVAATRLAPEYAQRWDVGVLDGPHGAAEFFTDADVTELYAHDWEVHFHSDRTGVRLIGPRPAWARADGGEAGLHPSNIHDTAYAVGSVDFTGDMPVILGPDGPSLGGFVCPVVVAHAELWKLGQLRPGDKLRFHSLTPGEASELDERAERTVASRAPAPSAPALALTARPPRAPRPTIVNARAASGERPAVTYRASGDRHLLIEYGPMVLDLELRARVEVLRRALEERRAAGELPGIVDLTPGVRSLQIHHDPRVLPLARLVRTVEEVDGALPSVDHLELPTRTVWMPLSWDDPATREAIERYMRVVRDDAPWCPSNLEFIRRVNGLGSIEDVRRVVFDARYLVLGLGDVYLGAPVATPLDPRHRLVTTKYNPARTWTPENAVGIGGAYLCIYGMEGPGGYQFVGRTVPVWNTHRETPQFVADTPWLLRSFDQLAFYPVEADELLELRRRVRAGTFELRIEPGRFSLREYRAFLASIAGDAASFKTRQQAAFDEERQRWRESGELEAARRHAGIVAAEAPAAEVEAGEGFEVVSAPLGAQVWRVVVKVGQGVRAGDELAVLEAMKTETRVVAPCDGRVDRVLCSERQIVSPGAPLVVIEAS